MFIGCITRALHLTDMSWRRSIPPIDTAQIVSMTPMDLYITRALHFTGRSLRRSFQSTLIRSDHDTNENWSTNDTHQTQSIHKVTRTLRLTNRSRWSFQSIPKNLIDDNDQSISHQSGAALDGQLFYATPQIDTLIDQTRSITPIRTESINHTDQSIPQINDTDQNQINQSYPPIIQYLTRALHLTDSSSRRSFQSSIFFRSS